MTRRCSRGWQRSSRNCGTSRTSRYLFAGGREGKTTCAFLHVAKKPVRLARKCPRRTFLPLRQTNQREVWRRRRGEFQAGHDYATQRLGGRRQSPHSCSSNSYSGSAGCPRYATTTRHSVSYVAKCEDVPLAERGMAGVPGMRHEKDQFHKAA